MRRTGMMLGLAVMISLAATVASPQKSREEQLRTVRGHVVDRQDNPAPTAVVYLKNLHTMAVRTYISDDAGQYRFSGLDPNVDYEIHAERDDTASATRTVSSFDSRKEIVITLKLDRKKGR